MNQAVEQKLCDSSSWDELLTKAEQRSFELRKPFSCGTLWAMIHMNNAQKVLSTMGDIRGQKVLDVGCGGAWFAKLVNEKGGEYVGMDLSRSFCQIALVRMRNDKVDGAIVCADAETLPFRSHAFERAFAYESMHHLPEPYKGIREALRVSNSFTLGDEPAKLPKPIEFFMVNILKRSFKYTESSGYESYRFDPKLLKLSLEQKGYFVTVKRQWTYVPKVFTRFESNYLVTMLYLSMYSLLMKCFRFFSHCLMIHIEPRHKS